MTKKPTYEELEKRIRELEKAESESQRLKKELAHSHRLLKYIISHAPSSIAVHDRDLNYLYVSNRYLEEYKVKDQNIIGKHHYEVFPDLPQKWRDVHQQSLKGEVLSAEEDPYYREDGSVDWTRWECRPWYDADDSIGGFIIYTEITNNRRQIEAELEYERSFLSAVLDNIEEAIVICDAEGCLWRFNKAARILHGIPEKPIKPDQWAEYYNLYEKDGRTPLPQKDIPLFKALKGEHVKGVEIVVAPKDSRLHFLVCNGQALRNRDGKVIGAVVAMHDITERNANQQALRESEKRYRDHFSQFPIPTFVWKFDGYGFVLSDFNMAAEDITEGRMDEIKGIYADKLHADNNSRHILESLERCYSEHKSIQNEFEYRLVTTGKKLWIKGTWVYIEPDTVVLHSEDITERRQALIALEESKTRYESIYNNAQVGLSRTQIRNGKVLACNQKMADIFGYDNPDEFVGKVILSDRYVDKGIREKAISEMQKTGSIQNREARFYRKDGQVIWARFDSRIFPDYGYMEDVVIDITQQKESEEKLLGQQKAISLNNKIANVFLTSSRNSIFANTLDVILETLESSFGYFGYIDDNGNLNCPSMTRNIWDKCEVPDKSIVFPKEIWGGVWGESLKNAITVISNKNLKLPEGHIQLECAMAVPIIHHDEVIGQFVVADKESGYGQYEKFLLESAASQTAPILNNLLEKETQEKEYKKMQARIEQAQKMEAVGNLAGGIAHDFNNILFPIIGMSELMMEDLEPDSLEYENAQEIHKAGNRAKDLVTQILSFSRQTEHEMMPVKLQKILKEVLKLCRATIPTNIEIELNIQQDCGSIWANATQLHQIGMNLITNAYHAVQDKNGKIMIQLKELILERDDIPSLSVSPGKFVLLSVTDNGTGMSEEIRDKIFEPYFTTKEKGKGTGLGLAVVYGIVKDFGGDIQVLSTLGAGATFNVYLPLMKKTENGDIKVLKKVSQTGDEHILLVDDEPSVARLEKLMLERLGYTVTQRVSSIEALEAFKENPEKFNLVISDMSMPAMTGDQLAYELRQIRPETPIIICTGFSDRINKETAEEIGVNGFLMKPIVKSDMAEMVRKVLDNSKKP